MMEQNPQVQLEGQVKLKTWYPYLELSDDEEGRARWRIVLKTENQRTLVILREKLSGFKRTLYAIPFPIPPPSRYATLAEQKIAKRENLWRERQIIITVKLEDHLRYTFPSIFTHNPLNIAAMLENPIEDPALALSKLMFKNKYYESISVAAALHRAFLRFVAKKIVLRIKKPTLNNRITHLTKGLDRGDEQGSQAEEFVVNDWGWECPVDTTMRGIKTEYAPRSWNEEVFDRDKGFRRYRVFRMSNLRHSWRYEEEGADEKGYVVEESEGGTEKVAQEVITDWDIDDPWWEETATSETSQWGNV